MEAQHGGIAVCVFAFALAAADASAGTIFKCIDAAGQVHYQSTACEAERPGGQLVMKQAAEPPVAHDLTARPVTGTVQPGFPGLPDISANRTDQLTPYGPSGEKTEAFKKEMAAYQQCTRDNATAMHLTEAAQYVIALRGRRQSWELYLLENSKSKYPNPSLPPADGYP